MTRTDRLRARLVGVASLSALAACGTSGGSQVGTTGPGTASAGATGVGGGAATAGGSGGAGGGVGTAGTSGGTSGMAGTTALGGTSGSGGTAGMGGTSGAGGAGSVPCPPVANGPPVTCYAGAGDQPDGCGEGLSGGNMGCYAPGSNGAPPSPCLAADDPSLPKLIGNPCESFSMITGPAMCRETTFQPGTTAPACCYAAKVQGMCQARPFFLAGVMRTAGIVRSPTWGRARLDTAG